MRTLSHILEDTRAPALELAHSVFKRIDSTRYFKYDLDEMWKEVDPKQKNWVVYSLGISFHDPQGMAKLMSGPKLPNGVQNISTYNELEAAWKFIIAAEAKAYSYSRNADY